MQYSNGPTRCGHAGRIAAGVFGLAYVGLQTMVHFDLIEIDHSKMKELVEGK